MGKTYPKVIELLNREFDDKGVTKYAFCKQTGINPTSVERYLHGISEPSQASLEKLGDYFGVTVSFLRGAPRSISDRLLEGIKLRGADRSEFNARMTDIFNVGGDYWRSVVNDEIGFENRDIIKAICKTFQLNEYWLLTGGEPPSSEQGGFAGEIDDPVTIGIFGNYIIEKGRDRELAVQALKRLVDDEMYNKQVWLQDNRLEGAGPMEGLLKLMYETMVCVHDLFPGNPEYTDEVAAVMKKIAVRTRNNYTKFLKGEKPADDFAEEIFGDQGAV